MAVAALTVRPAREADLPRLHALAERAVWTLLPGHYTQAQLRGAGLAGMYAVERQLVDDGTYYAAVVDGTVVGGSGWGVGRFHPPGPGAPEPGPVADRTAVMRATYVDPDWARRGIATLLARATEVAARLAGYERFEALCTPPSAGLRLALGYRLVERVRVPLPGGLTVTGSRMRKEQPPAG